MENSPIQVYVKQSASDEVLIRIKEMERKISEKFSVEEGMSEVNAKSVAEAYGVSQNIANMMLNHDVGDFTTVAKLVILQREGVSFSEINKFAKNNNSSMEGFFSTLFTSKSFKIEYLLSDFENKVHERLNYISGIEISDESRFSDLHSFFKKNAPEYIDSLCLSYRESAHEPDLELAKFMVLKDNGASKELLNFSYRERIDYAPVYVALNYEGGQEKIMELSSMLRNLEISKYEFTDMLYDSLGDHEMDDNKQGGDIGQPLLKEAITRNSHTSESDINSLTDNISATLDNRELVTTNFSSPYSNSLESLGNMLAVS
ncbi:hypothetical protein ACS77P_07015 [Yersinia enterocolitica]|uniref:hypothetical protein n=1 Tax=Yersinia enterocolitica TaxID=630 RepID=UPI003F427597